MAGCLRVFSLIREISLWKVLDLQKILQLPSHVPLAHLIHSQSWDYRSVSDSSRPVGRNSSSWWEGDAQFPLLVVLENPSWEQNKCRFIFWLVVSIHLKNISQHGNISSGRGEHKKNIWNHQNFWRKKYVTNWKVPKNKTLTIPIILLGNPIPSYSKYSIGLYSLC